LVIRIANPEGNRVVPKGKSRGELLRQLKKMVRSKQREEFDHMFGMRASQQKSGKSQPKRTLEGLVPRRAMLYRAYKGKEYKAWLTPKGTISLGGRKYTTPSGAGRAVAKHGVNGWTF
jgi:hypothetical protein